MAHKSEHVSTAGGFSVLNSGTKTQVITQAGVIKGDIQDSLAEGSVYIGNSSGITSELDASGNTKILVGNGTTATSVALSGDVTMTNAGVVAIAADAVETAMILDANVTLGKLASTVAPSHVTKYAGTVTWSGGGATLATTVTGVAASDIVIVSFSVPGTEGAVLSAVPTTDTITFTLDTANTSNDAVISYQVLRATA